MVQVVATHEIGRLLAIQPTMELILIKDYMLLLAAKVPVTFMFQVIANLPTQHYNLLTDRQQEES
jgi:hypothetical protein